MVAVQKLRAATAYRLLQLRVLGFSFFQDGVSGLPSFQRTRNIFVRRGGARRRHRPLQFRRLQGIGASHFQMSSGHCTRAWSALSYLPVTRTCTLQKKLYASSNNMGINSSLYGGAAAASAASTLTGTAGTGQACNDTTHTAGSIVSVKIVTQASTTAGYFSVGMKCD
jgi:hypothetical protein